MRELHPLEIMVLDAIANDYEPLDQISEEVARFGSQANLDEIIAALQTLVSSGLAVGYELSSSAPALAVAAIDWHRPLHLYFYVSAAGKALLRGY